MDRRTQQDYISWRAPDLARSGQFRDWSEIVRMLRYEGAYGAHKDLTSPYMRAKLNWLCDEARARLGAKQEKPMPPYTVTKVSSVGAMTARDPKPTAVSALQEVDRIGPDVTILDMETGKQLTLNELKALASGE